MISNRLAAVLLGATALTSFGVLGSGRASAQTAARPAAGALQEVTVTARRREESIVDVPLAISVVTAAKLEQLDLTDTTKLANYVPSLQFSDYTPGYARNDRGGTRPLIFRGLNLGAGGSVTAGGTMFLDGAAVVGNEIPAGLDIGAVEVLRGPQSVYFGRSTMTGAVAYRTKAIPKEFAAEANLKYAQRNDSSIEASVAGPLIDGVLGARLTGLVENTDGYVTNTYAAAGGSGKLGDRSRKSISGTLDFTPTSTLEFKGYANYFRDVDGPSATAYIRGNLVNCKLPGASYSTFCGEIPGPSNSFYYHNTNIPAPTAAFIFSSKLISDWMEDKVGLQREVFNSHLTGSWQINDYLKLSAISAFHTNTTLQAADGVGQPFRAGFPYSTYFYSITNKARDVSQEVRLSSDPERRFSWTVGATYIDAYAKVQALNYFVSATTGVVNPSVQLIGTNSSKTTGAFAGAYFDLTDRITLSAEGRYQIDKRYAEQGVAFSNEFKSFNPRLSIDFDLGGGRKVYASYATGTRPGGFNANVGGYLAQNNPVLTAQIVSLLGVTTPAYEEEELKVYELGVKGDFFGRGYFDINLYTGKLTNQQVGYGAGIPFLGFTVTAIANVGETELYGVEWQGNLKITDDWSLATTAAYNHTERTQFINTSAVAQFGTTNLAGTRMAYSPDYSASAVLSYTHPINDVWSVFANGAYVYRGKLFVDDFNAAYVAPRSQFDLRAGVSKEKLSIEAFLLNAFDDQNYTAGAVASDFGVGGAPNLKFSGAQAPPRQFGVRLSAKY